MLQQQIGRSKYWFLAIAIILYRVVFVNGTELQNRIFGGYLAPDNRYPYFAYIESTYWLNDDDSSEDRSIIICGGILIAKNVVMTAAHCIDRQTSAIEVTFNYYNKNKLRKNVVDWEAHHDYEIKQRNVRNDIALIYLEDNYGDEIPPIDIQFNGRPDPDDTVSVMGFGATNDNSNDLTEELNEISLDILENQYCRTLFGSILNTDLQFCTGGNIETKKGACKGDSGGPAIIKGWDINDEGSDVLVGIVSFGAPRCSMGLTVYTRISGHENWIKRRVCKGGSTIPPAWCGDMGVATLEEVINKDDSVAPIILGCFSGSSSVNVEGIHEKIKMQDLNIGDRVHVGNNIYEPVYSFGHRTHNSTYASNMIQISTMASTLTVTPDHLVFTMHSQDNGPAAIPASQIQVGDRVVLGKKSGNTAAVTALVLSVKKTTENALFSPFTPSGRIVVDDILSSNYIAFEDTKTLYILPEMGLNHHWLAHAAMLPYRLVCYHFGSCKNESYSSDGISEGLIRPLKFFRWLFTQRGGTIKRTALLSLVIPFVIMLQLWIEILVLIVNPLVMLSVLLVLYYYRQRLMITQHHNINKSIITTTLSCKIIK